MGVTRGVPRAARRVLSHGRGPAEGHPSALYSVPMRATPSPAMPRPDRPIVLIVSEDDRVRQAGRALPPDHYEVTYASSAQSAIAEALRYPPEVAVLELQVGDFGGFALAKQLRDLPGIKPFQLVMLCDRPHDRWLCRQAGAAAVIVKPLADPSELRDALDAVMAAVP